MCNHVDDIVDMYVLGCFNTLENHLLNDSPAPTIDLPKPSKRLLISSKPNKIPEIRGGAKLILKKNSVRKTYSSHPECSPTERIRSFTEAGELRAE